MLFPKGRIHEQDASAADPFGKRLRRRQRTSLALSLLVNPYEPNARTSGRCAGAGYYMRIVDTYGLNIGAGA